MQKEQVQMINVLILTVANSLIPTVVTNATIKQKRYKAPDK